MEQDNTQLRQIWERLLGSLNGIFALQSMSGNEYMSLYNHVYRYFQSAEYNERVLREKSNKLPPQAENDQEERRIPGGDLYYQTRAFFREYLEGIAQNGENLQGEEFLRFYAKTWEKYQFSSQIANGVLQIVNQNWVTRQRNEGAKHIYHIHTVAMHIWQNIFFKESNHSLSQTCLSLIENERNGIKIDTSLTRQVVESYVSAGFDRAAPGSQSVQDSLATYVTYFEKSFLEETERYYRAKVDQLVETCSIIDYVKEVNRRFEEEENRARAVLHPTTLEKIKPLLETILIANQTQRMQEELKGLLLNEKIEEIRLVFNLINRIPDGNRPIRSVLHDFVREEALNAISRVSAVANKDPKAYVEAIIEVFLRFDNIVKQGFRSHADYTSELDRAFSSAVNNNAVTQAAGKTIRSPDLLAAYCDILLRKGNKLQETDIEEKLNQIMMVFNYVEDKDAFQKFYGKRLAKRLVGQLSASDDYEESMISKLKQACGFEYISRLQRMFQDIRVSKNLIEQYQADCQKKQVQDIVSIDVMVLGANAWPFSTPPSFNLPVELRRTFDSFTHFYTRGYTGRKLEWLHQYSKGELQTLYTKPKYFLQVSVYQMTILLLFNSSDSLQVEEIQGQTAIENDMFLQVLLTLLKSGVLKCSEVDSKQIDEEYSEKNLRGDYTIQVDENYRSKKIKVNLNVPLKSVEQKESEKDDKQINDDRKMVMQAAIVRIMKARKSLKHSLLTQEVIDQLKSHFKPKVPIIKQNIEILIEKEYLERDSQERDLLRYLA